MLGLDKFKHCRGKTKVRKSFKHKIIFILSTIFFLTALGANINNVYTMNKTFKTRIAEIKVVNNVSKDEEKKINELIKTMDEAIQYLNYDNMSTDVKKQLIKDIIESVNVISHKLNINNKIIIKELNKQYGNLEHNNNIDLNALVQLYKEWRSSTNYS